MSYGWIRIPCHSFLSVLIDTLWTYPLNPSISVLCWYQAESKLEEALTKVQQQVDQLTADNRRLSGQVRALREDNTALCGRVDALKGHMTHLQNRVMVDMVGFTAFAADHSPGNDQVVQFGTAEFNAGGYYDETTYTFTCPTNGVIHLLFCSPICYTSTIYLQNLFLLNK